MLTPELREKLDLYRQKVVNNTITREELIEAVRLMRDGRLTAATTRAAKATKTKESAVDSDSLLDDFLK